MNAYWYGLKTDCKLGVLLPTYLKSNWNLEKKKKNFPISSVIPQRSGKGGVREPQLWFKIFPCWSAGRTKAPWWCPDTRRLEDAVGYGVRWVCWELLLRTEVSSPHVGINSRRYPCLPIAEPSGPFLKILSPSGCSGHLVTEAETSRKEGDLTVSILIDSSYSRFSGKDTRYFICWGTKWRKCTEGKTGNGKYRQLLCVRRFAEWLPWIISINSLNNPMIYL